MLKDLNWSTLENRRKVSRLTLLSRIVHHQQPAIQMPQYFFATDLHHQTIPPTTFYITSPHTQHYQECYFYRIVKE